MSPCPRSPRARVAAAAGQRGFTLVELITVILILGVLAAVAMPRFADLAGKARESKVKAVAGSLRSAANLVKASAMAGGVACGSATGTSVSMEGRVIALNHCYPQALNSYTDGVLGAANVTADDGWTTPTDGLAAAGSSVTLQLGDASTPASCKVVYTSPASVTASPTVLATTSGC